MRARDISLHILPGYSEFPEIAKRLGPHKRGKSCWYIKGLSDVDKTALGDLIRAGVEDLRGQWPVEASWIQRDLQHLTHRETVSWNWGLKMIDEQGRATVPESVDVVVVGAGFSGMYLIKLIRELGLSVVVLEQGGGVGGTWYWNRYPGAACDVESYIYLPLCEELNFVPKEKYTHAPEILAHSRNIGEKYDLYKDACFQTEVTGISWQEDEKVWLIQTNRNDADDR